MKIKNNFCSVLSSFSKLKVTIKPYADRQNISPESAILLYIINNEIDLKDFFKIELYNELQNQGFINFENEKLLITGKGAIFAKSITKFVEEIWFL